MMAATMIAQLSTVSCSDDGAAGDSGPGSTSNADGTTSTPTPVGMPTGGGTGIDSDAGSDAPATDSSDTEPNGTDDTSSTNETEGTDSTGVEPGTLPAPVEQSGVAYVAHFLSTELRWYRTDGDVPSVGGSIDTGGVAHDLALDGVGDRLYVAQDVAQRILVYGLTRPDDADDPVDPPMQIGTLDVDTPPRFVRVDPYHDRLYVVADGVRIGSGTMQLHTVDVSDPAAPAILNTSELPSTTSLDIDGPRRLLVLFHGITDEVFAYDVSTDSPVEVASGPVDLRTFYPEENQVSFGARNLTLDPWHARLYAARPQGGLSELIVMDYPAAIPGEGQPYDDAAEFSLSEIDDPFDLSVDIARRPGILDAHTPMPSATDELVFLLANAWNGMQSTATLVTMAGGDPLTLEPGCADHEEFGCFLRSYSAAAPIGFLRTDSAACRDTAHGVVVGTALGSPEDEPGQVAFFQYEADASTTPWLSAAGGNLPAGVLPIAAVCH